MQKGKPFVQCSLRKLHSQGSLSSWVFSWGAVGVLKVPWCCGVGPCPGWDPAPWGTGHCCSLSLCRGKAAVGTQGNHRLCSGDPFLMVSVVLSSWLHQQGLWSSLASSRQFVLLSCHEAQKWLLTITLSAGTYPLLAASLLGWFSVWYKLHFFWPVLVCHVWEELASSLAGCLNAMTLSRVAALCCSCSFCQSLWLEKQSPLSSVEGLAGLCSPLPWCAELNCPEAGLGSKGWQGFAYLSF